MKLDEKRRAEEQLNRTSYYSESSAGYTGIQGHIGGRGSQSSGGASSNRQASLHTFTRDS